MSKNQCVSEGTMVYLIVEEAQLLKTVGGNSIYYMDDRYYVGIETLTLEGKDVENCISFSSLELAEECISELPQPIAI